MKTILFALAHTHDTTVLARLDGVAPTEGTRLELAKLVECAVKRRFGSRGRNAPPQGKIEEMVSKLETPCSRRREEADFRDMPDTSTSSPRWLRIMSPLRAFVRGSALAFSSRLAVRTKAVLRPALHDAGEN